MTVPRVAESVNTAQSVAVTTAATGFGHVLEVIPDDVGKLASLVGICLSVALIFVHLRRSRREAEKHKLEMQKLRAEVASLSPPPQADTD